MTKTRLQFLAALFLITLPFLGFPVWLDSVLVSTLGAFIALTTFLNARERRLRVRSNVMVDEPRQIDKIVESEAKATRPKRKAVKKKIKAAEDVVIQESENAPPEVVSEEEKEVDMEIPTVEEDVEAPIPSPMQSSAIKKSSRRRVKTPVFSGDTESEE